jgi:hypothetical protein
MSNLVELVKGWKENPIQEAEWKRFLTQFTYERDFLSKESESCASMLEVIIEDHNIDMFKWFLQLSDKITLVKQTCIAYWKLDSDVNLLLCIADWPEAFEFLLDNYIHLVNMNVDNLTALVFDSATKYPALFSKLTSPDVLKNAPPLLQAILYHHLCFLGYFEEWKMLFSVRQEHWWTFGQCMYYVRSGEHPLDAIGVYEDITEEIIERQQVFLSKAKAFTKEVKQSINAKLQDFMCKDVGNIVENLSGQTVEEEADNNALVAILQDLETK